MRRPLPATFLLLGLLAGCEDSPSDVLDGRPTAFDIRFTDSKGFDGAAADARHDGAPAVDGAADASTDGTPAVDGAADSAPDVDSHVDSVPPADLSPPDTSVDTTADSALSIAPCSNLLDPATVALYTFEGGYGANRVQDETGDHDGSYIGSMSKISGPTGCGNAVDFGAGEYATVPASSAWNLSVGSVSLWARFADSVSGATQGVLSRDASSSASGSQKGHFNIMRDGPLGRIIVRLQDAAGDDHYFCSDDVVPFGTWVEIAVNFGPPQVELYIDGVRATSSDTVTPTFNVAQPPAPCNPSYTGGIDGNNEPWLLGASAAGSEEGSVEPIGGWMTNGAIDHLRISSMRRDFAR